MSLAVPPLSRAQSETIGSIVVFAAGADGDAEPIRAISGPATGLRLPDVMVVDRRGRLYVTNTPGGPNDDTVRVFALTPKATPPPSA